MTSKARAVHVKPGDAGEVCGPGKRSVIFCIAGNTAIANVCPPPGWQRVEVRQDGASWRNAKRGLVVILSVNTEADGKLWVHLSCSHARRTPTHEEMAMIKGIFLGDEIYAISVLPPKSMYVNIHPYCLHLWACLDGHPLPEFSAGLGTI